MKIIRSQTVYKVISDERKRFLNFIQANKEELQKGREEIGMLEQEAKESLWVKQKLKHE